MIDFRKTRILMLALFLTGILALIGCQSDRTPVAPPVVVIEPLDGPPQLTIANPTFDFGYTPQFSYVARTFWLKSTGEGPVEIIHISSG